MNLVDSKIAEKSTSRRVAAAVTLIGGYIATGIHIVRGLVLVPLYLSYIGDRLYGAWLGSGDIISWLSVLDMGLATLMIQRIAGAYGRNERQSVGQYFATGLLVQLGLAVLLILGAIGLSFWLPGWMGIEGQEASVLGGCFVLASVGAGLNILNDGVVGLAKALQSMVFWSVSSAVVGLLGLGLTAYLLLAGFGLWSIPVGVVVGRLLAVLANSAYALRLYRSNVGVPFRPTRRVWQEFASTSPQVFLGKLGARLSERGEGALIAIFMRPELTTVFVVTRRAADIIRSLLDRIGGSVFAGFSHLVGSGKRERAVEVHKEIMSLFTSGAVLLIASYMAMNQTFIKLWVGEDQFGGQLLTVLLGLALLVSKRAGLLNYLYGATGEVVGSSLILFLESLIRVPLMFGLLHWLGLPGLPLAAILTSLVNGAVSLERTKRKLGKDLFSQVSVNVRCWVGYLTVLGGGIITGAFTSMDSWLGFLIVFFLFVGVSAVFLVSLDSYFRHLLNAIKVRLVRLSKRSVLGILKNW